MLRPIDKRFDRRFSHSIKLIFDNYVPKYEELNHGTPTEKERLQFNSWKTIWLSKEQSIELRIRCDNYNEILHCELLRNYRTKRGIFFQSRNEILLWTIDGCRADEVGPVVKSIQLNSSETFKLAEKFQWTNDLNDSMRFERAHNKPVTMANIMPFISQNQQTNVWVCVMDLNSSWNFAIDKVSFNPMRESHLYSCRTVCYSYYQLDKPWQITFQLD